MRPQHLDTSWYIDAGSAFDTINKKATPIVVINLNRIQDNLLHLQKSLTKHYKNHQIFYALKANYLRPIVETLKESKVDGLEVISELEYNLAKEYGFLDSQIVFNGMFRNPQFIQNSMKKGAIINIDSLEELKSVSKNQESLRIGIRVHPNFAERQNFVQKGSKLGISEDDLQEALQICKNQNIQVHGLSCHLFSNQRDPTQPALAITRMIELIDVVESKLNTRMNYLDIGGGLIPRLFMNNIELDKFIQQITEPIINNKPYIKLILEPGRFLVSDALYVVSSVKGIKINDNNTWAILDIGSNYLIPAQGSDFIVLPIDMNIEKGEKIHFADAICSPAGTIDSNSYFNNLEAQSRVVVANAGAYTTVMKEQFVFSDPVHVFVKDKGVLKTTKRMSLKEVLNYLGE